MLSPKPQIHELLLVVDRPIEGGVAGHVDTFVFDNNTKGIRGVAATSTKERSLLSVYCKMEYIDPVSVKNVREKLFVVSGRLGKANTPLVDIELGVKGVCV